MKSVQAFFYILILSLFMIAKASTAMAQADEITLSARISGNQEQPSVLTIVPWQKPEDFNVISSDFDDQMQQIFPHLDPTEFAREREFATASQVAE